MLNSIFFFLTALYFYKSAFAHLQYARAGKILTGVFQSNPIQTYPLLFDQAAALTLALGKAGIQQKVQHALFSFYFIDRQFIGDAAFLKNARKILECRLSLFRPVKNVGNLISNFVFEVAWMQAAIR